MNRRNVQEKILTSENVEPQSTPTYHHRPMAIQLTLHKDPVFVHKLNFSRKFALASHLPSQLPKQTTSTICVWLLLYHNTTIHSLGQSIYSCLLYTGLCIAFSRFPHYKAQDKVPSCTKQTANAGSEQSLWFVLFCFSHLESLSLNQFTGWVHREQSVNSSSCAKNISVSPLSTTQHLDD